MVCIPVNNISVQVAQEEKWFQKTCCVPQSLNLTAPDPQGQQLFKELLRDYKASETVPVSDAL